MSNNIILTFHEVKDEQWFDRIINFFITNYEIVSVEELYSLMNSDKLLKNIAHITIDDGNRSFYDIIFPILKKYHLHATLFVSPKIINENKNFWFQLDKGLDQGKMIQIISVKTGIPVTKIYNIPYHLILKCLTIDGIHKILEEYYSKTNAPLIPSQNMSVIQLIEVERSGLVTIGAHTLNHPILSNESVNVAENEIIASISELQTMLGHSIDFFAYPNGLPNIDFSHREIKTLRTNNIKLAFSGEFRPFNWKSNPLCMPRMGFSSGTNRIVRMKLILGRRWAQLRALNSRSEEKIRNHVYSLIWTNSNRLN